MKKLLTLALVLVCSVGWCAGTTAKTTGESTVQTGPASFTNFVQLGELATPLKCKIMMVTATDTVNVAEGYAHGLGNKIVSVTAACNWLNTYWMSEASAVDSGLYQFHTYYNDTYIAVWLGPDATSVTGKPIRIVIWYRP